MCECGQVHGSAGVCERGCECVDAGVCVVEERERAGREGERRGGRAGSGQLRGCTGTTGPRKSLEEDRRPRGLGGRAGSP